MEEKIWEKQHENVLKNWAEIGASYSWMHDRAYRDFKVKNMYYAIPVIILSTITGTANFATDSYVPENLQHGFSAGVGTLNIACGILGTLLAFLKYAEIYEGHRISALAWSKLSRSIEIELSLQDAKRKSCRDFLKICRAEYDNLLESSPNIDLDIITFFNKKFDGKYKEVRRPIICNGLKEIKPYKLEEEQPEPEPEPEPETPILPAQNP